MQLDALAIDESVSALFPPERLLDALRDSPVETTVIDGSTDPVVDCDAVVTFQYRERFLDVEWIHSVLAGVDRFPRDRLREEGVVLTNSTGIHGDAIGETVAGYVLSFARRLHEHAANQRRNRWSQPAWDEAWTVAGERACVVGLGSLGRGIVDRLTGLGLDVDGVRRTPVPEPGVGRVYTPSELERAVSDAKFVALAVPLTDETRGLIDGDVLAAMREDAYLLNVARGDVVDQDALVTALEEGTIAGAALDVFETEPLPESSPLWEMDEVILTPHAGSITRDYYRNVADVVREGVRRIRAGSDPVNRVL
ncbi:D-2-hydroxyacid dehydrogenase [Halobellus limi]|uniref:D-2-hydroxyacid dehydrogenase n=1 Tax=Halobellus limi TaxID=699433 RepID=A0A1H6BI16_9EURY|nr:D-2-hydroxyacid dehydrogenase [Halobellus limi]QCC49054.1 D-2-hydroxyacid dehydrogenase [Halobellus limi]SEG60401.1 D-2-hydroxyacid dehydrogenase (NADP+) [Halobellus limi]